MELQKKKLFEPADWKGLIQVRIWLVYDKPGEYQKNAKQSYRRIQIFFFIHDFSVWCRGTSAHRIQSLSSSVGYTHV